jgi:methylated-DNA-[protein]-cysteine S-methyltransferase
MYFYDIFTTGIGDVGIVWRCDKRGKSWLARVLLPVRRSALSKTIKRLFPASVKGEWQRLRNDIHGMFQGRKVDFDHVSLFMQDLSAFQKKLYAYERCIPRGKVISYDRLGIAIGKRSTARAVGQAQAANPFPLVVPCHRVIKSSGEAGQFQCGNSLKVKLLSLEGLSFHYEKGKAFVNEVHSIK